MASLEPFCHLHVLGDCHNGEKCALRHLDWKEVIAQYAEIENRESSDPPDPLDVSEPLPCRSWPISWDIQNYAEFSTSAPVVNRMETDNTVEKELSPVKACDIIDLYSRMTPSGVLDLSMKPRSRVDSGPERKPYGTPNKTAKLHQLSQITANHNRKRTQPCQFGVTSDSESCPNAFLQLPKGLYVESAPPSEKRSAPDFLDHSIAKMRKMNLLPFFRDQKSYIKSSPFSSIKSN